MTNNIDILDRIAGAIYKVNEKYGDRLTELKVGPVAMLRLKQLPLQYQNTEPEQVTKIMGIKVVCDPYMPDNGYAFLNGNKVLAMGIFDDQ